MEIFLEVSEVVGIDAGTDAIQFGSVPPGGTGSRNFTLGNIYDIPLRVEIKVSGEVKDMVTLSENNFWLQPGESKSIKITAAISKDTEFGEYSGKMLALFKRK